MKIFMFCVRVCGLILGVFGSLLLWQSVTKSNITALPNSFTANFKNGYSIQMKTFGDISQRNEGNDERQRSEENLAKLNESKANLGFALQTFGFILLILDVVISKTLSKELSY